MKGDGLKAYVEELDLQRRQRAHLRKGWKAEYETGTGGGQMSWWEAVAVLV